MRTKANDLLTLIAGNDVTAGMAPAGPGKTPQTPQMILDEYVNSATSYARSRAGWWRSESPTVSPKSVEKDRANARVSVLHDGGYSLVLGMGAAEMGAADCWRDSRRIHRSGYPRFG